MRSNSNRKPISLMKRGDSMELVKRANQFDMDFHQNILTYLNSERQRLKSLDKVTAKKIIDNAERNLMNFMKSRSKVNCFKTREGSVPYHTLFANSSSSLLQTLFDHKKLEQFIQQ